MQRIIFVYGFIAGLVVIGSAIIAITLTGGENTAHSAMAWLGYLIMLIALSSIFVAIKRYRDTQLGGVIGFGKATLLGLGISVVAGVIYVVCWEIYLVATDHAFISQYVEGAIAAKQAEGMGGAELDAYIAQMNTLEQQYANPLFRVPMTFLEIFPVGLLITLVSAAILRNGKVLPATA